MIGPEITWVTMPAIPTPIATGASRPKRPRKPPTTIASATISGMMICHPYHLTFGVGRSRRPHGEGPEGYPGGGGYSRGAHRGGADGGGGSAGEGDEGGAEDAAGGSA